jgi:hypothetical protein
MVAGTKPMPDSARAWSPGRPLDVPEADWSEAVRREATVRPLATAGVNSQSAVHAAAASLGLSTAQVYRLIARFRGHPVTLSLVVAKPGPKKGVRLLPGEIELRIEAAIDTVFKQPERPTLEKLRRDIRKDCDAAGPGARIGPLAERAGKSARRHKGGTAEVCSGWSWPAAVPSAGDRADRSHQGGHPIGGRSGARCRRASLADLGA